MAQQVKNLPAMQETQEMQVPSLGQEEPLEKQWQSLQCSCLENSNEQRSLLDGSLMGSRESQPSD